MNETQFLSYLRKRLVESNVDSAEADKYAEQFKRYFDNLSEEEVDEQMSSVDSMDSIVSNLVALIEAKKMRRMQNESSSADKGGGTDVHNYGEQSESAGAAEIRSTDSGNSDTFEFMFSDNSSSDKSSYVNDSVSSQCDDSDGKNNSDEKKDECSVLQFGGDVYSSDTDMAPGGVNALADISTAPDFSVREADSSAVTGEYIPVKTDGGYSDTPESPELKPEVVGGSSGERVICGNSRIGKRADPEYGVKTESFSEAVSFDEGFFFEDEFSNAAYNAAYNDTYSDDEFVIPSEPGPHSAVISATRGRLPERRKDDPDREYEEEELTGIRKYIYRSPARIWADITSEAGKKRFWGISLGTLPITIPLTVIFLGLFAGAFAALAGVILTMMVGLIGLTVAGSAFSLISIIYGITQLFSTAPVGVYEIGIGIISAGITILAGILIYNAAVRLVPIAIGYLIRFFFYTVDRIKGFVYHFREECAKLK